MRYVEYSLVNIGGAGEQPYGAVAASGALFEGGYFVQGNRYVGYLDGTEEQVSAALEAMAPWQPSELTVEDVLERAEALTPTNTALPGGLTGPPVINENGRLVRELLPAT